MPSPKALLSAVVGILALWWFTLGDNTSPNGLWGGLGLLARGISRLPGAAADTAGYRSWWRYMSEQEGWPDIVANTVDHAQLVLLSLGAATVIAISLGILVFRVPVLRGGVLGLSSIMLTVPSLALFALFIPIGFIGIGDRGPLIALTLYSILPILRNTVTGLEEVDSAIVESARGMGVSGPQRLLRVELPLAWPVILTGMRVAALLNVGIAAVARLVGGTGLGLYINDGLTRFPQPTSVERMWTGVVFTILLALAMDAMFAVIRAGTTPKGLKQ